MRGEDIKQSKMFYYISPESRIPQDHPLRPIKAMVNKVLQELSPQFSKMYSSTGRPSIAPEKLLKALLLQVLYSIRSERLLVEQLDYNFLFRWFVGLNIDDPVWDHSSFSKNRDRLIASDIAVKFLTSIKAQAQQAGLLSDEHFTVDGSLIEAWASLKSFRPKGEPPADGSRNPEVNFHGEKRKNDTHASTTDPDARLYRKGKGKEAKLYYAGHALIENKSGLVIGGRVTLATGSCEREAAVKMVKDISSNRRKTVGADKAYDHREYVQRLRKLNVTAHVAQKSRGSAIDGRTIRHEGYTVSQRIRKRVEEIFGWIKTVGLLRKTRHRGRKKVNWIFLFTLGVYNLVRMRNLGVAMQP